MTHASRGRIIWYARMEAVLTSVPRPMISIAPDGQAKRASRSLESVFNRSTGELIYVGDTGLQWLQGGDLDRMFEQFYSTKPEGMGMGLSICRSIVESHGGKIWADPKPGGGAVISFTLPINEESGEML